MTADTRMPKVASGLTFIDVFSGCGGLSYGLELSGHRCLAAIDHNEHAINTFNMNHSEPVGLSRDLLTYLPSDLEKRLSVSKVDMIVGGPPCQGFSIAKRVGGGNNGPRQQESDPRRDLYKRFLKFVKHFEPKIFVMENVLGIKSTSNGHYFTAIQDEARSLGYSVAPIVLNCWEFGVPQSRVRQIFVGVKVGMPPFAADRYLRPTHSFDPIGNLEPLVTMGEAICDLPPLQAGEGSVESTYDLELRARHIEQYGGRFLLEELRVEEAQTLTWHLARPQSERDLRDFARLQEGESSRDAIRNGTYMEFPYARDVFKNRYTRQSRSKLCSTIVAHLRRDGLMYIHPTQLRSISPREAARIQTFPDTFEFCGQRGNVFEQIGNAVPPLAGRAIGIAITEYLSGIERHSSILNVSFSEQDRSKALKFLEEVVSGLFNSLLLNMTTDEFLKVWRAVHIVKPNLHPDNATETSGPIRYAGNGESQLLHTYYVRTGWPLDLIPVAEEAIRRRGAGEITDRDFYFETQSEAAEIEALT